MNIIEDNLQDLKKLLEMEQRTQSKRWEYSSISKKELRKAGELLYPLQIKGHGYNQLSSPVLSVHYANDINTKLFTSGSQVILFNEEEVETCKAVIIAIDDRNIELQLLSEDIEHWILNDSIGLKPSVDEKSFKFMNGLLNKAIGSRDLLLHKHLITIYKNDGADKQTTKNINKWFNESLNSSQKYAVEVALEKQGLISIQGPPGTGKTTTLVEIIAQHKEIGKSILASAPSNTAIDHLAKRLIQQGIKVVRLGNTSKVDEILWNHTPTGILAKDENQKQIKKLRKQAEQYQKKASQYKRNFTKEDRENRKMWRSEIRKIKVEIKKLSDYILSKEIEEVDVILGTPVGICDELIKNKTFDLAVIDEAGQCLIPMGFLVMDNTEKVILCGDHQQLPPTVIDPEADQKGLGKSILELALMNKPVDSLLALQYRMPPVIADFSSRFFYDNEVKSDKTNTSEHLYFYDTAGSGYHEVQSSEGSIFNEGEMSFVQKVIEKESSVEVSFISPYAAQVNLAKKELHPKIQCNTIDGFQGQENDVVIISLVRSNEDGKIGFLSDYRRMNVALTRAKDRLYVIGDSATLGNDPFYKAFIDYCEQNNCYHSVFELLYE